MPWKTSYLMAYNVVQLSLWAVTAIQLIISSKTASGYLEVYESAATFAITAQTLAWAEVIHAGLGLGGTVSTAFVQCLGRYVVLIFVIDAITQIQDRLVTMILLVSWVLADLVRYAFYIATIIRRVPPALLWMRYSLFLVLYPAGIVAEWMIYYWTLPYVESHKLYNVSLPNEFNFSFDFGIWNRIVLILYMYFGPFMFFHMLHQRKKKLVAAN
ncbi:unnamed protein product [Agarophyton chilense]